MSGMSETKQKHFEEFLSIMKGEMKALEKPTRYGSMNHNAGKLAFNSGMGNLLKFTKERIKDLNDDSSTS